MGREGGRGAEEEGWGSKGRRGGEGRGGEYCHFFLYTLSTGDNYYNMEMR